jgi:hypothetical protein
MRLRIELFVDDIIDVVPAKGSWSRPPFDGRWPTGTSGDAVRWT